MENVLMISDAARQVQVESHVLRYWEEELHLPIHRNEQGHRYYTQEDVEIFKQIKSMKERGLQLKAIRMILKDGRLDVITSEDSESGVSKSMDTQKDVEVPAMVSGENLPQSENREEKARRLQWLLQQMMRDTLRENNKELSREIKESVIKELDYQFRMQEEKQEELDKTRREAEELHYQKLDELLRRKSGRGSWKKEVQAAEREERQQAGGKQEISEESGINMVKIQRTPDMPGTHAAPGTQTKGRGRAAKRQEKQEKLRVRKIRKQEKAEARKRGKLEKSEKKKVKTQERSRQRQLKKQSMEKQCMKKQGTKKEEGFKTCLFSTKML